MNISLRRMVPVVWVLGVVIAAGYAQPPAAPTTRPADYPKFLNDQSLPPMILSPDITLKVKTVSLDKLDRKLDGQWMGNGVASDGKFYFGAASHSHDTAGMFLQYDPKTDKITVLSADLSATGGEDAKKMVPQGKTHTAILEHDGWLYFGTHTANYWDYAQDHWQGSHLMAYKLGSAEAGKPLIRDLGRTREGFTLYAGLALDPKREYLYYTLTRWWKGGGGGLYRCKLDGSQKTELVYYDKGCQTFFMFCDQRGDVWFAEYGQSGTLIQVHGDTGKLTLYPDALPQKRSTVSNVPNDDGRLKNWGAVFSWGMPLDGDRCLMSMHSDGGLWEFDTTEVKDGDAKGAFTLAKWIGRHSAAITRMGDSLYFIQSANPKWANTEHAADLHLKRSKLDANAPIEDLGRLVDQEGRTPNLLDCLAADKQGNLFIVGTWRVKSEEIGTEVSSYSHDKDSAGSKPFGQYYDMWRGLFFTTLNVKDITAAPATSSAPAPAASQPAATSAQRGSADK